MRSDGWRRFGARAGCLLLAWLALASPLRARAAEEEELKAAIIYNLLMFVEWPADAVPATGTTLVLCLQPGSRYAAALTVLAERPVRGLQVQIRQTGLADAATTCNALLLEDTSSARLATVARIAKTASLLVIADGADIASDGVVINLRRAERKLQFDVNLGAARHARLQLSSKLMRLAREVIE